ncbi:MAG TPA: tetratricopeptide repeat protein, partial [Tepidisphaeraceae bacterium]|nr:tetratricopeptide repeat protein [Tepidisphaeraceae bacterium]
MSKKTASIADDPHALPDWLKGLAVLLLLLAVTCIAYIPTMRSNVRFIWGDDDAGLVSRGLHSMSGLQKIWFGIFADPRTYLLPRYQPMASTLAWIEWRAFGLNPRGYHVVSIVMHALCGWMAWLILSRLAVPGALVASLLFVAHPMAVQSVAWQAEQGNVLALLLGLSSLYVWLRYTGLIAGPPTGEGKFSLPSDPQRIYAIGMILLVAALLSRPTAAVVPVALVMMIWWKRGRIDLQREFLPLLPLFVVSAAAAGLAGYMEVVRAGATGSEWQFGSGSLASELTARVLMSGQAVWFYFGKLIWPFPTMFNYPQWDMTQTAAWAWIFPVAAVIVLSGLVMSRNRIGRGPICATIIFIGALFPVLGFINVRAFRYAIVWDYFAYWALLPMLALIAAAAVQFWTRRRLNAGAGIALTGVVLFLLTGFSFRQANAYVNNGRLWDDTLRKNPASTLALNELGRAALENGDLQRAHAMFERVLAVDPLNPGVRLNFGLLIEASGGRLEDAIAWYRDAVDLRQRFTQAWQRLGMAYQRLAMERR